MVTNQALMAGDGIHIAPRSGTAFTLNKGQVMRVIDVEGEQVCDLFCFAKNDTEESLSSGHTVDYNEKLFLSTGDVLYSNQSNPMLTVIADRVGKHMMLYAPCSQEMFSRSYGSTDPHPNCLDNLSANLRKYKIRDSQITVPFNIFMNIKISSEGRITIKPPTSKAGDYVDLQAETDLVVGISACSAGLCNNYKCTSIEIEILK